MVQTYVWLNGVRLPIKGVVSWRRVTPFPAQFTTGQPQESDYTPTRKQKWGNLKGGLGKDKWTLEDNDRYSEGSVDASQEVQTLPGLVTTMGAFGVEPVKLIKYEDRIWAIGHNQISYWNGTSWTSVKTNFPNPTDAIVYYGTA